MTTPCTDDTAAILSEIASLEQRLHSAKARLQSLNPGSSIGTLNTLVQPITLPSQIPSHLHALLLLSDSALPLGSFAFSNGLESFLAHRSRSQSPVAQFTHFLRLSLDSVTSTTLPYVIAAYLHPEELEELDNDLDASTPCTVARRASTKQGLALLGVWEKSFKSHFPPPTNVIQDSPSSFDGAQTQSTQAFAALKEFSIYLKSPKQDPIFCANGHLPPLLGTLCAALGLPLDQTLYVYLFNHAKTIISAAIRAGVLGPYQAQGVLGGRLLQEKLWTIVAREAGADSASEEHITHSTGCKNAGTKTTQEAGQSVPMLDLWSGRHEIIYSRIFNS